MVWATEEALRERHQSHKHGCISVNSAPDISWIEESSCELCRFPLKSEAQQERSVWTEKKKSSFFFRFLSIPITLSTKEHWRKMHQQCWKKLMRASCLSLICGIQQHHGYRAYLTSPEEQNLNFCGSRSRECALLVSFQMILIYCVCNWRNTKATFVEGLKT